MARVLTGERLEKELARLEAMKEFEREYDGCSLICGVDEAGRGPLAGPVAAGAVILPKDCMILYLNDSKKLSEKRREELFLEIRERRFRIPLGSWVRSGSMRSISSRRPMRRCARRFRALALFRIFF